ncbi:esterase-like activity of phytase family protein [Falsiruegeria mediterranea]
MRFGLAVSIALALVVTGTATAVDLSKAQFLSSYTWHNKAKWFGGFSAIEMSDDGRRMTILSDRAKIATAEVTRQSDAIASVRITSMNRIHSSKGKALSGRGGDSEGLTIAPDGSIFISFEGVHRVARYQNPRSKAQVLPIPGAFKGLAENGSFEPLAIDRNGHLYTMPESGLTADGRIPVYRWNGRHWSQPFSLPTHGNFLPVGADIGPDGRFYLLERSAGVLGFRSQLRRWEFRNGQVSNQEVMFRTGPGTHDNLEGVSVWRDQTGTLRATMVSDDNFLFIQRTELVEYALPN